MRQQQAYPQHPCRYCGRMIETNVVILAPMYCSDACDTAFYTNEKKNRPQPAEVEEIRPAFFGNLTVKQAAKALGVGVSQVKRLIHDGKLAASMIGGQWLISRLSVDRYVPAPVGRPRKRQTFV